LTQRQILGKAMFLFIARERENKMTVSKSLLIAATAAIAVGAGTSASAYTLYNTLGGTEAGGDPLSAAGPTLADRFVTNGAATLDSVTLNLELSAPAATGFTVELYADNGANPPTALAVIGSAADSSLTNGFQLYTFSAATPISLAAGTSYYIGLQDNGQSTAQLGATLSPSVLNRQPVVNGADYYNNGGVQANAGGPYELSVNVAGVPEPGTWTLMIVGFAGLGAALRRSRLALA
jgi:hypothetical protein